MAEIQPQYFDLKTLSKYACISVGSLRDYVKTGLPHFRLKGKILIKKSEFDAWLEGYRVNKKQNINNIVDGVMSAIK